MHAQLLSHVRLFATPWTVICQALLFMETSKQEYWSRLPFPILGDLPSPGIKSVLPVFPALAGDSLPLSHHSPFFFFLFQPSTTVLLMVSEASMIWPLDPSDPITYLLQPHWTLTVPPTPPASICYRAFAVLSPLLFHTGEGTTSL